MTSLNNCVIETSWLAQQNWSCDAKIEKLIANQFNDVEQKHNIRVISIKLHINYQIEKYSFCLILFEIDYYISDPIFMDIKSG